MNAFNEREPRRRKTVTARLSHEEWRELHFLAQKNFVLTSDYLRGIIIDALIEERELALQRSGTQARTPSREERTVAGGTAA